MRTNLFLESTTAHAQRTGLPEDRTRILRRVLTLKREGYPSESVFAQMGADNVTWAVAMSTPDELERILDVIWEDNRYSLGSYRPCHVPRAPETRIWNSLRHVSAKSDSCHTICTQVSNRRMATGSTAKSLSRPPTVGRTGHAP